MLHEKVEQTRLRQLWQIPENLIGYQMEATGPRLKCKFYLLYHRKIRVLLFLWIANLTI